MFEGTKTLSVDAKGRIAIPTCFRDDLIRACEGRLHITRHYKEDCLLLFPENEWEKFRAIVAAWPMSAAWEKRRLLGSALALEMDPSSGRILISPELREASHMGSEAQMMGNGSHFELWDKALYRAKDEAAARQPSPDFINNFVF